MQSESTSWTVLRSLDGFPATLYIEAENLQWQKVTSTAQPETSCGNCPYHVMAVMPMIVLSMVFHQRSICRGGWGGLTPPLVEDDPHTGD